MSDNVKEERKTGKPSTKPCNEGDCCSDEGRKRSWWPNECLRYTVAILGGVAFGVGVGIAVVWYRSKE